MAAELAGIAERQGLWDNQFERNAEKAQDLLAQARAAPPGRAYALRQEAARQLMLAGEAEPAIQLLRALDDEIGAALPPAQREALRFDLALAWLRLGETENCIKGHNSDSCLLPIRGGGVHAERLGSKEAAVLLTALLEDPTSAPASAPMYRWLLNVAHMTLGQYPEGVPERWRIPPAAFASEHDIGRFTDVAASHGLRISGRAGGAILDDFDADGHLDVMTSSWGQSDPLQLFRNRGDGTFAPQDPGLPGINGGLDIFQGDYDNDGRLDVFVPRGAWTHKAGAIPGSLLHNDGGGRFSDRTAAAGVLSAYPSQAAAWCDLDGDGWLDLVKANELHSEVDWPATAKNVELFHNRGDGRFADVAPAAGVTFRGMIKAVVCGDYDNDGAPDLYFSVIYGANKLFRNLGNLKFADVTVHAGVAEPHMSFTSWFFDYDNDGWEDLFVTGYLTDMANIARDYLGERGQGERPRLYRNNGDGTFTDVAPQVKLDRLLLTMGGNFGDLDNDGWLDVYVGTGAPPLQILDPSRAFRNDGGKAFQDVTTSGGFGHLQKGHGIAFGDADGDGDQDIFSQVGGAFTGDRFWSVYFENPGHGNRWLTLRLSGVRANRSAIGARIAVEVTDETGAKRTIHRVVNSGGSFGASSLQQEIGLGRARSIDAISVRWPGSGTVQRLAGPLPLDRIYRVVENESEARPE